MLDTISKIQFNLRMILQMTFNFLIKSILFQMDRVSKYHELFKLYSSTTGFNAIKSNTQNEISVQFVMRPPIPNQIVANDEFLFEEDIQLRLLALARLLNKPCVNEFYLTGQNPPLKYC